MTSVTSMLTSIGIGAPPASFSDAKKAAANQKSAVGDLTNTVSGINTSLSLLTATGAPASVTGPMKDNLTSANALLKNASSMTPAELTQKSAAIQSQHEVDTMNHANITRKKDLTDLIAAEKRAIKIIKSILANKKASQKTRDACVKLMTDIQAAKKAITNAKLTREGFVAEGSLPDTSKGSKPKKSTRKSSQAPLIYVRPDVLTPDDIDIYINIIQDGYDDETDNNFGKLYRNGTVLYYKYVWPTIFFTIFAFCVIVAGIISSNACLPNELYSIYNRAFYFFYGAILFPITLPMYSILYPPEWYSTICPLYSNDGRGPVVADELDGNASLLTSASDTLTSAQSKLTSLQGAIADPKTAFLKMFGGAEPATSTDSTANVAKPPLKGATHYYYPLVNDAVAKANLGKMSLVATILVWGYLISIGGISLLSSF